MILIHTIGPLLAQAPERRRAKEQIAIVDGTLIPTRDHRLAAQSKNYRYSANLQCRPWRVEAIGIAGAVGAVEALPCLTAACFAASNADGRWPDTAPA